jgi:hypothetical protein
MIYFADVILPAGLFPLVNSGIAISRNIDF